MRKAMYTIEHYVDTNGEWRFRIVHRNGRVIAVSSESYRRRGGALRSARRLVAGIRAGQYEISIQPRHKP